MAEWLAAGQAAANWAWAASTPPVTAIAAFIASATPHCLGGVFQPANICFGRSPSYTPGFAPISVCWGWLFIGIFIGVFCSCNCVFILYVYTTRPSVFFAPAQATGNSFGSLRLTPDQLRQQLFQQMQEHFVQQQQQQDALEMIQHLIEGGPTLLQDLANASQTQPVEFLGQVMRTSVSPTQRARLSVRPSRAG